MSDPNTSQSEECLNVNHAPFAKESAGVLDTAIDDLERKSEAAYSQSDQCTHGYHVEYHRGRGRAFDEAATYLKAVRHSTSRSVADSAGC